MCSSNFICNERINHVLVLLSHSANISVLVRTTSGYVVVPTSFLSSLGKEHDAPGTTHLDNEFFLKMRFNFMIQMRLFACLQIMSSNWASMSSYIFWALLSMQRIFICLRKNVANRMRIIVALIWLMKIQLRVILTVISVAVCLNYFLHVQYNIARISR